MPPIRRPAKKKKKKQANCFEKCTAAQLKQLCKAAQLPVSGAKAALVERLLAADVTQTFAYEQCAERWDYGNFMAWSGDEGQGPTEKEYKGARRPDGLSNADLKEDLRTKGLKLSGTRFEMVLRRVEYAGGDRSGVKGGGAGSSAGPSKPRAKSMKLPDPAKLAERMARTADPDDSAMDKWSNGRYKDQARRCVSLVTSVIGKEIVDKELFKRGEEQLAWAVVFELAKWLVYVGGIEPPAADGTRRPDEGFACPTGIGRCEFEITYELFGLLISFLDQTSDECKGSAEWVRVRVLLRNLKEQFVRYGIEDEKYNQALVKHNIV